MSKEVTAAEILDSPPLVPKESLDSQVSNEHIAELARKMKQWEVYMPYLLGEDSEAVEEEIQCDHKNNYLLQKQKALIRWREKFGRGATYCRLIEVFCTANEADLAENCKGSLLL